MESERAEKLEREEEARSERRRRSKRRRLDDQPQAGSARDLGCVSSVEYRQCCVAVTASWRSLANSCSSVADRTQLRHCPAPHRSRDGAQRSQRDRAVVQDCLVPAHQVDEADAATPARPSTRRSARTEEGFGARRPLIALPRCAAEQAEAEQVGREGAASGASRRERLAGARARAGSGICGERAALMRHRGQRPAD